MKKELKIKADLARRNVGLGALILFALWLNSAEVVWAKQTHWVGATLQTEPSAQLSSEDKRKVITALTKLLEENYVFPEIGKEIAKRIKQNQKLGKYKNLVEAEAFAKMVTKHLRSINGDRHLSLWYQPEQASEETYEPDDDLLRSRGKYSNYGFEEVKILPGNVGYIKMSSFSLDQLYFEAQPTITAAIKFVSHGDALIIDLRDNPGGSARMIKFLASYLFDETPVHLNDYYFRHIDHTEAYWTLADVPGVRLPHLSVYILINKNTFSAAEGFSYNLKHLGRTTIIGERSGGGSHGGSTMRVSDQFVAYVPYSRSIHPVTKTDWEGQGVVPHMETDSDAALLTAHTVALKTLSKNPEFAPNTERYAQILATLKAKKNPLPLDESLLERYAGIYEFSPDQRLTITKRDKRLYGQMTGDPEALVVIPISGTRFRVANHQVEFTFNLNDQGRVIGLTLHQGKGLTARKLN